MVADRTIPGCEHQKVKLLNLLEQFFENARPTQHLQFLEYWLELLLTDRFYDRNSPSDLLHRQMEYTALIAQIFQVAESEHFPGFGNIFGSSSSSEQVDRERNVLSYFPVHLDENEISAPECILSALIETGTLEEYKAWLLEWLSEGLNCSSSTENSVQVFPLYKVLKQLIEACWLINQRAQSRTNFPVNGETQIFQPLVHFITSVVPAEYIFCLHHSNNLTDLMVILDRECGRSFSELEPLLEFATVGFPNISCTLHSYGTLNDLIEKGRLYYLRVCKPENCLYIKPGSTPFPNTASHLLADVAKSMIPIFIKGIGKADRFYQGATNYLSVGEQALATFMLQQACELTYRTLLQIMRGTEIKSHELSVLRKHLRRYFPEVIGIFAENEKEELRLLNILERAYIDARYHTHFSIAESDIQLIHNRTFCLIEQTRKSFNELGSCFVTENLCAF